MNRFTSWSGSSDAEGRIFSSPSSFVPSQCGTHTCRPPLGRDHASARGMGPGRVCVGVGGQTSSLVTACSTVHPGAMGGFTHRENMVAVGAGTAGSGPSHSESPELAMAPFEATVRPPYRAGSAGSPSLGVDRLESEALYWEGQDRDNPRKTQRRHM